MSVALEGSATCFTGGVELSLGTAATPTAFLPWDATEALAASRINSLLTDGSTVKVLPLSLCWFVCYAPPYQQSNRRAAGERPLQASLTYTSQLPT